MRCVSALPLETAELGAEYGYNCLPLCVIDAVWSIGVRYGGVKRVISRYCDHFALNDGLVREQHGIRDLVQSMDAKGADWFRDEVFQNAQRTSTRNGITKAQAVYRFASALHKNGIDILRDVPNISWYEDLCDEWNKPYVQELLAIPGPGGGISVSYFFMLAGSTGLVKPDRMVNAFLKETLNKDVNAADAQRLLAHASRQLSAEFPLMTPRMLDHQIWKYQSGRQA